jgi:hypothetical protein
MALAIFPRIIHFMVTIFKAELMLLSVWHLFVADAWHAPVR